jgi:hypothetical protein
MKHDAKRTRDWIMSAEFDEVCMQLFARIQRGEKVSLADAADTIGLTVAEFCDIWNLYQELERRKALN